MAFSPCRPLWASLSYWRPGKPVGLVVNAQELSKVITLLLLTYILILANRSMAGPAKN
jgi:hypothetical protein